MKHPLDSVIALIIGLLILNISCGRKTNTNENSKQKYITGKVTGITDGDTFKLLLVKDNFEIKVRLSDIDCPEKKQPYSKKAKEHLSNLIFGKQVKVYYTKKDGYGRVIGTIYINGHNVNEDMVRNGLAWHFKKYSVSKKMAELEKNARNQKTGLWHDPSPIPPWEWRKRKNKIQ